MRLVVDTNIFVSAALKEASWPAETVRWIATYGGLLKSAITEQELPAVLQRPRIAPKVEPDFFDRLRRMLAAAELVTITERVAACRDPDDDKFVELAVNGNTDAIIYGDADLRALDTFRGIPIIVAAAFLRTQVRALADDRQPCLTRTTKLYDPRSDEVSLDEVEKIAI
jgi:putative PIN family toxin of toxin-antitoxin system